MSARRGQACDPDCASVYVTGSGCDYESENDENDGVGRLTVYETENECESVNVFDAERSNLV